MASETRVYHPNREKSSSQAAKAAVVLLLIVSAVLIAIVTIGGWKVLQGAQIVAIAYILIYALMAYFVAQWNRGALPLAAALAILLVVVAAISVPGWFDRDATGYEEAALPAGLLGLITILIVPVQILLIIVGMTAFNQKWNVEVEMTEEEYESRYGGGGGRGGQYDYQPAT